MTFHDRILRGPEVCAGQTVLCGSRELHLLVTGLTLLLAVGILALGGCRRPPAATRDAFVPVQAATRTIASDGGELCSNRPRCSIVKREPGLVVVQIEHVPDASTDEDRCNHREYWLPHPSGGRLVATDCDVQWGADNAGPAEVRMDGAKLEVRYIEYQSNDRCELHTATVDVAGPTVITQNRVVGAVSNNTCVPTRRSAPLPPIGDGSREHPLLTLHRE